MEINSAPLGVEPSTQRIRTAPLHDARQLAAFQQAFSERLFGIHVEPLHGHSLTIDGTVTVFDGMVINIGMTSPSLCVHPGDNANDDGVMLTSMLQGQWQVQARTRGWDLASGDSLLTPLGQTQTLAAHTKAHLCGLILSRSTLASMAIDVDAMLQRPLRGNPVATLLVQYAHLLRDHHALASSALRRAATLHIHELAALLAGAAGDVAHQAHARGVRAARLLAVKNDIAAHFTDPRLSVVAVALRQGITPRYLQMLLEQDGQTFTTLVLERRLSLAWRLLQDSHLARRTVSAIAFEVGFGDLSYFNRSFRRHYGMSPSDARIRCAP